MKTKILYMIDKLTLAGSQKHVCTLATNLDRDKFEPVICAVRSGGPLQERYEAQGIRVWVLGISKIYGFKALKSLLRLRAIMKNERVNVVHCYQFNPTVFGVVAAKLAGVRVIITARRDTGYWASRWHHYVYRILNLFTTRVIVNSLAVKEATVKNERLKPGKISLIYNGIDVEKFKPAENAAAIRERYGVLPDEKVVGMVAVIRPEKRYEDFINACGVVAKKHKNVKFFVVGSGYPDLTDRLKRMCKDFGIENKVVFTGRIENIPEILSMFDVGCLTSRTEGFSNVILEYMAAGVVPVATRVGGNTEIVHDNINGILVPPKEHVALADAIVRVLDDVAFRSQLAIRAKETVVHDFKIEKMLEATVSLYERLIRQTKGVHSKIKQRLRSHGVMFVVRKTLRTIIKPVFQLDRLIFFEKMLDTKRDFYFEGKASKRLKSYSMRLKKKYELLVVSGENANGFDEKLSSLMRKSPQYIRKWFDQGKYCFIFAKEGRIISYFWLTLGARYHDFMGKDYKADNEAFVHTALTVSQYRSKGFASILLNEMLSFSRKKDIKKMYGFIVIDNAKSINSFAAPLGFDISKQRGLYVRIFNREKYFIYGKNA